MKPFFSYYGSKYNVSRPRRGLVIEPFAGSASYSTRWNVRDCILCDLSVDVVETWDWLINSSERDVSSIPDSFDFFDQISALSKGASLVVRWWVSKGRAEPSGVISPWYFKYRNDSDFKVWGSKVKKRILEQKPLIQRWKVRQCSYKEIENAEAHWHIDPPYQGLPGSRYPQSSIDYDHLSSWCRDRMGAVDVCENYGASWLPFKKLCLVTSTRGRRDGSVSAEAYWRKD